MSKAEETPKLFSNVTPCFYTLVKVITEIKITTKIHLSGPYKITHILETEYTEFPKKLIEETKKYTVKAKSG